MTDDSISVARGIFTAFATKDRVLAERLIAEDFHFTSPLDNRLDRAGYFTICWPNSGHITHFDLVHLAQSGPQVFATYVGTSNAGKKFRNTEILTIRDGQITEVEVYFGWSQPHEVAPGQHKDP